MKPITVTLNRRASRLLRTHLRENPDLDVRDVASGAVYFLLDKEPDWADSCAPMAKEDRLSEEQIGAAPLGGVAAIHAVTVHFTPQQHKMLRRVAKYDDHTSIEEMILDEMRSHVETAVDCVFGLRAGAATARWDGPEETARRHKEGAKLMADLQARQAHAGESPTEKEAP